MAEQCFELTKLAKELGMEVGIVRGADTIDLYFDTEEDREYFTGQAFTPGLLVHVVTFDHPREIAAWMSEVERVMEAAFRTEYELREHSNRVRFSTHDQITFDLFRQFDEQGMFEEPGPETKQHGRGSEEELWAEAFAARADRVRELGPASEAELAHLQMLLDRFEERTQGQHADRSHDHELGR